MNESQETNFPQPEKAKGFPLGKKDLALGIAVLLCAICLTNSVLFGGLYLGCAVFGFALVLCAGIYLLSQKKPVSAYGTALLVLSLIILAAFARSDDGFVKFIMLCFLFFSINLGLCVCAGRNLHVPAGVHSLKDAFRTFFGMGFGKLPDSLQGIGKFFRDSKGAGKKSLSVLLGLVIAIPIVAIMLPLLTSADAAFDGLMALLPTVNEEEVFNSLIVGFLLWCILFARTTALVHAQPAVPKEKKQPKGIAAATVNTVLIAVVFVYCVYLLSQLAYFFGGFSGILPESYTMAEYARRGFFEMAALCLINLTVILFAAGFVRKDRSIPLATRLLCLFIGVVTLLFVVTASAKMCMYIGGYGLTRLRLLTEVIMVFMGFTTAVICIWLFAPRLPYMKVILLTALAIGAVVIWLDVDTMVAAYNVKAYETGALETIDVFHLSRLGDGAIPYLARLTNAPDPEIAESAARYLKLQQVDMNDLRDWNYASYLAQQYLPKN